MVLTVCVTTRLGAMRQTSDRCARALTLAAGRVTETPLTERNLRLTVPPAATIARRRLVRLASLLPLPRISTLSCLPRGEGLTHFSLPVPRPLSTLARSSEILFRPLSARFPISARNLLPLTPLTVTPLTVTPLTVTPLTVTPLTVTPLTVTLLTVTPLTVSPLPPTPLPDTEMPLCASTTLEPSSSAAEIRAAPKRPRMLFMVRRCFECVVTRMMASGAL